MESPITYQHTTTTKIWYTNTELTDLSCPRWGCVHILLLTWKPQLWGDVKWVAKTINIKLKNAEWVGILYQCVYLCICQGNGSKCISLTWHWVRMQVLAQDHNNSSMYTCMQNQHRHRCTDRHLHKRMHHKWTHTHRVRQTSATLVSLNNM